MTGRYVIYMKLQIKKIGFTLIELVIAVAVFAIIVIAAISSYQAYLRNSAMRTAGQTALKDAQYLEKYKTICGSYVKDSTNSSVPPCFTSSSSSSYAVWPTLPYLVSPESGTALYRITFTSSKPSTSDTSDFNSYRLKATPICGTLVASNGCVCVDQDNNILYEQNASCNNSGGLCSCTN